MRALIVAAGDDDVALATILASDGHTIHALRPIASHVQPEPARIGRLTITSVGEYPPMIPEGDPVSRSLQLNLAILERGAALLSQTPFDVVHAGSTEFAYATTAFGRLFGIPVVTTLRTPAARAGQALYQMTVWLVLESNRIIVRSRRA